jgi:hypothetical protein
MGTRHSGQKKSKHQMKLRRTLLRITTGVVGSLCIVSAASAATTGAKPPTSTSTTKSSSSSSQAQASSAAAVQGYASDKRLQVGTIVALSGSGASKVEAATSSKASSMYGATVDGNSLSLTVSSSALQNEAYVATSGTYKLLVSTQNGPIKAGDYITVSSIDGVGMQAQPQQTVVFGRAASDFDGKTNVVANATLKVNGGSNQAVSLGIIPVAIDIRHNPNQISTKADVPKVLQRLGQAIADKPVGPLRIYLSIAITGISVVSAIVLLYGGVRNSIISIGRNPLSKKAIFRALIEIVLTSIIVLIIGLFAVYLLLKL